MPLVDAIPAFRGTALADRISFTAGIVYAAAGNDRITLLGTGRAYGGSGDDVFFMGNRAGQQAFGGFGDDFFSVTGTGALRSAIKGGDGNDTVLFRGAMSATVEADAGTGLLRGVDNILSYSGGMTLNVLADRISVVALGMVANRITISDTTVDQARITLGGGDDRVNAGGSGHRIDTGGGNDRVTAMGAELTVTTGSGNDTLTARGFEGVSLFDTGSGNDVASLSGQGRMTMGRGNDTLTYNGGQSSMGGSISADMGSGDDRVVSTYYSTLDGGVNLGAGADVIVFRGTLEEGTRVTTGDGADTLVFAMGIAEGELFITDFNAAQDRLDVSAYGVEGVADVTRITQSGADTVVFIADVTDPLAPGLELRLANTLVAQVTDAIFV